MTEALKKFWETHPITDGWSIETERVEQYAVKATIKLSGRVVVTGHCRDVHMDFQDVEAAAIDRAIDYLGGQTY